MQKYRPIYSKKISNNIFEKPFLAAGFHKFSYFGAFMNLSRFKWLEHPSIEQQSTFFGILSFSMEKANVFHLSCSFCPLDFLFVPSMCVGFFIICLIHFHFYLFQLVYHDLFLKHLNLNLMYLMQFLKFKDRHHQFRVLYYIKKSTFNTLNLNVTKEFWLSLLLLQVDPIGLFHHWTWRHLNTTLINEYYFTVVWCSFLLS